MGGVVALILLDCLLADGRLGLSQSSSVFVRASVIARNMYQPPRVARADAAAVLLGVVRRSW